jgi:hypothetical protein
MFGLRILDATTKWFGFKLIRNCLVVLPRLAGLGRRFGRSRFHRTAPAPVRAGLSQTNCLPFESSIARAGTFIRCRPGLQMHATGLLAEWSADRATPTHYVVVLRSRSDTASAGCWPPDLLGPDHRKGLVTRPFLFASSSSSYRERHLA